MLTRLRIRNFKRFEEVDIELGSPVVFIGPNNSGKTTALQALALWELGLRRWSGKREAREAPAQRPGVAINRRDLYSTPIPDSRHLWRDLKTRTTRKVPIEILVEGVSPGPWTCGLEFTYANTESVYCRPMRTRPQERMAVPEQAAIPRVAFLPPMSGLADREFLKTPGEIEFLIGQGRTAEVLRNLCAWVSERKELWDKLAARIDRLFRVRLEKPAMVPERGEIVMGYRERDGVRLDLSAAGRGFEQVLLLLAWLARNERAVLLLDEPDAHLEILRQRQVYKELTEAAREQGSQIVAASHSEVLLNEAAGRDVVVAFVGTPHRLNDRGAQLVKSLRDIGFEDYYSAEIKGWVLYLEGSTDLAILQAFAERLAHPAATALEDPFVRYVGNSPQQARDHFHGLREAKPDLRGFLLCDRLERSLQEERPLKEAMWRRREIENYLCQPETLLSYAGEVGERDTAGPLFDNARSAMDECIRAFVPPIALADRRDPWWTEVKASNDFLDRLFAMFFQKLRLPNLLLKSSYYVLARHVPVELIDPQVAEVLDAIVETARGAPGGGVTPAPPSR